MTIEDLVELAKRVHAAERMDFGANSSRDQRNAHWARIVGIAHWGHKDYNPTPDPQWHIKDGGGGRPQSDDVAVSMPTRDFWDCIGGAGAVGYTFRPNYDGFLPPEQNVYPPPKPNGGDELPPPPPAGGAHWTAAHTAMLARFPRPAGDHDRAFVQRVAEQFAYSFGSDWGMKSTRAGSPLSDNVLACNRGGLFGYKIVPAVTTPTEIDLTTSGQVFWAVSAVNHLGDEEPPPPPPPPPVEDGHEAIMAALAALQTDVQAVRDQLERGFLVDIQTVFGRVRGDIKLKEPAA